MINAKTGALHCKPNSLNRTGKLAHIQLYANRSLHFDDKSEPHICILKPFHSLVDGIGGRFDDFHFRQDSMLETECEALPRFVDAADHGALQTQARYRKLEVAENVLVRAKQSHDGHGTSSAQQTKVRRGIKRDRDGGKDVVEGLMETLHGGQVVRVHDFIRSQTQSCLALVGMGREYHHVPGAHLLRHLQREVACGCSVSSKLSRFR